MRWPGGGTNCCTFAAAPRRGRLWRLLSGAPVWPVKQEARDQVGVMLAATSDADARQSVRVDMAHKRQRQRKE